VTPLWDTGLLEGLEGACFVERASGPSDLRVTYARLTQAGAAALESASREHERAVAALLEEHLSDREIDALGDLLGRLPSR